MANSSAEELEDLGSIKIALALLSVSSFILLVVSIWHGSVFRGGAPTVADLAKVIVGVELWAPMHLLAAFSFALMALASFALAAGHLSNRGGFTIIAIAFLFTGSLALIIGSILDGPLRAILAPSVVRGENFGIFLAVNEFDIRIDAIGWGFLGIGGAMIALRELRSRVTSPRWLSARGLVGMLMMAGFGLGFAPASLASPGEFQAAIPAGFLSIGFIPAFAWLSTLGILTLRKFTLS